MPQGAVFCGVCGALVTNDTDTGFDNRPEPPTPDNSIICKHCGAKLHPNAVYCDACGMPVYNDQTDNSITCVKCGAKLTPDTLFCGICGEPVNRGGGMPNPAPQPAQKPKALFIVCICAAFVALAAIVATTAYVIMARDAAQVNSTASNTGTSAGTSQQQPAGNIATLAPVAAPTAQPTVNYSGEYLFPSDSVYIQDADLAGKSQNEVRLILNEIYARNGYIFNTDYYRQYFSTKSWYVPITSSQEECERRFNSIERANKEFIAKYEQARGWR